MPNQPWYRPRSWSKSPEPITTNLTVDWARFTRAMQAVATAFGRLTPPGVQRSVAAQTEIDRALAPVRLALRSERTDWDDALADLRVILPVESRLRVWVSLTPDLRYGDAVKAYEDACAALPSHRDADVERGWRSRIYNAIFPAFFARNDRAAQAYGIHRAQVMYDNLPTRATWQG